MAHLLLKEIPKYECLLECANQFPDLDPSAVEAYLHLMRAGDSVFQFGSGYIEAHGLSSGRLLIMMLLLDKLENKPLDLTPAELADQANVTRATISGLVEHLSRDGLVVSVPDRHDRRQKRVRLTDKGYRFLQDFLPGHFARIARLLEPVSENDRKTLVRILGKIVAHADSLVRAGAPAENPQPLSIV